MSDASPPIKSVEGGREPVSSVAPDRSRTFAIGLIAVTALGAVARLARWREVVWGPEVVPVDNDAMYHLRRSLDVAAGRGLPVFDPEINWPHGGTVPWAPGFDLLGGAVAWMAGEPYSRAAALAVASLPVFLGLVVVALAMALAWTEAPTRSRRAAALTAGAFAALVPQAITWSRFGMTDHHVAEAVLVAALALWVQRGVAGPTRSLLFEAAGALLGCAGVLFFTGAPVYVALAATPLVVGALLGESHRSIVGRGALGLIGGGLIALAACIPIVAVHGREISFALPSYLQPALVVLAGLGIALGWASSHAGSVRRRALAFAVGVVACTGLAALVPGVAAQVIDGTQGWLLAQDPWIATISEFQHAFHWAVPSPRLTWGVAGLALPLLALVGAAATWRTAPARTASLLFQTAAFVALSLMQVRFGRPAVPLLAAAGGIGLAAICPRLPLRQSSRSALAPIAVLVVFAADPITWATTAYPEPAARDALIGAAFDLRDDSRDESSPGVLAPWEMGHEVNVLARRPVVANGFGSYLDPDGFAEVRSAYRGTERELVAWMKGRRLGHIVAGIATFQGRVPGPGSGAPVVRGGPSAGLDRAYLQAVPLSAAILGGSGLPDEGVPHLEHLLPRFASRETSRALPFAVPILWAFDVVPGARLRGRTAPASRIVLEYALLERGRRHTWRAWTVADVAGEFELVVPLPTGLARRTIATAPFATLRLGEGEAMHVSIPEVAVRSGEIVPIPAR